MAAIPPSEDAGRLVPSRLWLDASRLARLARAIGGCSPSGPASTFTPTNGEMSCRRATSQAAADEQPHRLAPSRPTTWRPVGPVEEEVGRGGYGDNGGGGPGTYRREGRPGSGAGVDLGSGR